MGILSLSRISVLGVGPPWMMLGCWDLEFLLDGLGLRLDCTADWDLDSCACVWCCAGCFSGSLGVDWSLCFDLVLL